jgi:hypothetical protein
VHGGGVGADPLPESRNVQFEEYLAAPGEDTAGRRRDPDLPEGIGQPQLAQGLDRVCRE